MAALLVLTPRTGMPTPVETPATAARFRVVLAGVDDQPDRAGIAGVVGLDDRVAAAGVGVRNVPGRETDERGAGVGRACQRDDRRGLGDRDVRQERPEVRASRGVVAHGRPVLDLDLVATDRHPQEHLHARPDAVGVRSEIRVVHAAAVLRFGPDGVVRARVGLRRRRREPSY